MVDKPLIVQRLDSKDDVLKVLNYVVDEEIIFLCKGGQQKLHAFYIVLTGVNVNMW